MNKIRPVLLSAAAFGLLLAFTGGSSGCDSRPGDGATVEDGAPISEEQKAKVKGYYADRAKKTAKQKAPRGK